MAEVRFQEADTGAIQGELDSVLWEVLWRPLGLPRDIRATFRLEGPSLELVALHQGRVVGGVVLNWLSDAEVELRHIAVLPSYQKQSLGQELIQHGLRLLAASNCLVVSTYARHTSVPFFQKLGFVALPGEIFKHQWFSQQGVHFQKMIYKIRPDQSLKSTPNRGVARPGAL
jgi:N-acetylglutamate synthase-like GNAT family acetyltransferase